MTGFRPLLHSLFVAASIACVCPLHAEEGVVVLSSPADMLALWQDMCGNLKEGAQVRIDPAWGVTPKQAIDLTMQDLYADSYSCDYRPDTGVVTIRPRYSATAKLIAAAAKPELEAKLTPREKLALANAKSRIEALIKPGMSDYEKVLALHDSVLQGARFTPVVQEPCTEMLLAGRGVCEGYARSLHVLLTMAGMQARFAFGEAKGEKHLWNLVCVDGLWYHVDPTWDDGMKAYGYFLLTDKELSADHRWDSRRFHATAEEGHLYYRRNGLCPESYEALWAAVAKAWEDGAEAYDCYFPAFTDRATFIRGLHGFRDTHPEIRLRSWNGNHDGDCVLQIKFAR